MQKIVSVTDMQRQAGPLVSSLAESEEPLLITQRGKVAAVLLSPARYAQMEEDLQRLDELELLTLVQAAQEARAAGHTMTHEEVKKRLGFVAPNAAMS